MPDDDDGDDDGDDFADIVPIALATRRRWTQDKPLSAFSFQSLIGRQVRMRVNGFDVEGTFQGADDDDVYLRGLLRYFVYPQHVVTGITVLDQDDDDEDARVDNSDTFGDRTDDTEDP